MVRDVYAADDGSQAAAGSQMVCANYRVLIDLDPLALSRVINQLALSNLAPVAVTSARVDEHSMEVRATMEGLTAVSAEFICRKLQQLTCVFETDCRIEPLNDPPKEIA